MATFDVAVVGAGIHGASAAFHLAASGVRTTVFERASPASGPTGRSSAICRAYYTNEFLARCAIDSIRMMRDFLTNTGQDAGYVQTGALFLHPPEDVPQVEESASRLNELGIATEVLSTDDVLRRFPQFDLEGIAVAAWEDEAGYADPAATTTGLFRRAVELGAVPRVGSAVVVIERAEHGWTLLADDGSRTEAGKVLIAAGPWTRPLVLQTGVDLPLRVERHIVATFRWGGAQPMPLHADLVGGYYFRPEGSELFLMGPLHAAPEADPDHYSERVTEEEIGALSQAVVRRVPALERSQVHGGWASLYDVSPDWQPVIGEVAPGLFLDAGTSGHGFKLAPALGKHVADLVVGEKWDPGIEQFHPNRFEGEGTLAAGYGEAKILG
jgi:glycine/D-amino acid oxidase-like deaminating enzyme